MNDKFWLGFLALCILNILETVTPQKVKGAGSQFPMKQNTTTTWSWAHDGKNENGVVTFFANGTVSWNGGPKQGNWKLTNGNTVLQTTFNGIDHELTWKEAQEKAILDKPKRSPRSTMTLKPLNQDWIQITNGEIIVKVKDMSKPATQFSIKTKPGISPSDRIALDFLSKNLEKLGSIRISTEGIEFEVDCSTHTFLDQYIGAKLQSGIWSFQQTSKAFTVTFNGQDVYVFATDDECLKETIKAIEFEEKAQQTSVAYSGDVIKDDCDPGYTVTQNGACLRCPAGYFSTSGTATNCFQCPDDKFSPPGSDSESDCSDKAYFNEMEREERISTNGTVYNTYWSMESDISVVFNITRPSLTDSSCDIFMTFVEMDLEIDISQFVRVNGQIERSVTAVYGEEEVSVEVENRVDYTISVNFGDGSFFVTVTWESLPEPKTITFRKGTGALTNNNKIQIAVSDSDCLDFVEDRSGVERGEVEEPTPEPTPDPNEGRNLESLPTAAEICPSSYFRDCRMVRLYLNETWSKFDVYSLHINEIPTERGIKVTANNNKTYIVTTALIDINLDDGVSQEGFHLESEGGQFITALEYIVYQKPKSTKPKKIEMNRAPPNLTENEGDIESEYVQNYTIETEENEEVKSLITENLIPFVEEEEYQEPEEISDPEETEKIKVWRPKFQGSKVPMKVFLDKAEEYKKEPDSESNNDLIGYLAYNGFVDVGVNKNHEKQVVTSAEGVSSVSRDTLMDEDAMIETVKAFQKFNGFPETGELTEEEAKVISLPKCGNRDTSYKDEIDTFTCIEAINEMQSNNKREPCDLDSDSFLDICSKFPDDHLQSDEMIDKFVWRKGFFFEVDVDFRKSGKPNSHVGIAFNYEDSNRTSEYIFVQYEKVNKRLVFSYGTITKGKREPMKSLSNFGTHIKLDSYQRKYRQFKLRLTVGSERKRTASVSLNGRRIFTFNTILPTKSSVYLFTLGGSHYIDHNVRAFTARICRRNLANDRQEEPGSEVVRRRKRWSQTNFRWYPNGASITYAFINYSTELGELATRTVIEEALKVFASHGFQFEELNPFAAHNADIVFMFIRDGTHVDGKVFDGPSTEKAHAYVPVHGEIHFNDYEIFSAEQGTEAGGRTSLKYVAMHEIGHAMGIGHSDVQNAVMAKNYPGDSAFNVADLDEDDVTALSAQYSEIVADVPDPSVISQDYSSIQGIQNMLYEQRMPLPSSCLDRIDAAFYFYDRDTTRQQDLFYLMSFGYVWAYDSITNVLQDGYPKRLSSVFYGAPGEIDAAFDTGTRIFLISGQNVYIYTISYDQITFHSQDTLTNLFSITEPVSAAFNHRKTVCSTGSDTSCIGTTLVIDENKYFEIVWKKYGKVVARSTRGNSAEIIGKEFSSNLFGASFEYTKADGSSEVMIFQKVGRTLRSRVFFPGDAYEERTTWSDVPAAFSIVGWCVG